MNLGNNWTGIWEICHWNLTKEISLLIHLIVILTKLSHHTYSQIKSGFEHIFWPKRHVDNFFLKSLSVAFCFRKFLSLFLIFPFFYLLIAVSFFVSSTFYNLLSSLSFCFSQTVSPRQFHYFFLPSILIIITVLLFWILNFYPTFLVLNFVRTKKNFWLLSEFLLSNCGILKKSFQKSLPNSSKTPEYRLQVKKYSYKISYKIYFLFLFFFFVNNCTILFSIVRCWLEKRTRGKKYSHRFWHQITGNFTALFSYEKLCLCDTHFIKLL